MDKCILSRLLSKVAASLVLFCNLIASGQSQEKKSNLPVRIMFYNVENLFDIKNDSVHEDDEFLPGGVMRWTYTRYQKKISSVYKVIMAAGEWNPPAVAGFSEIENRQVLEDLVYGTPLSGFNYGLIHEDSPDTRGIDVCLIYRKDLVKIIEYKSMIPRTVKPGEFRSRSVLYVKCSLAGDTINFFVNHWPSRRGGVLAGEDLRNQIAGMVRCVADSLDSASGRRSKIIIMGDFNCGPYDQVIQSLVKPDGSDSGRTDLHLVDLAGNRSNGPGTYRYQGTWETLDQIIVSEWLLKCNSGIFTEQGFFRIFNPDFLLVSDPKYPGKAPFSTYKGYRYQGGFSDHLPVILDLYPR